MGELTTGEPEHLAFEVNVTPRGKDRPRASVVFKPGRRLGVHMRNTPETREFEGAVTAAAVAAMAGRPPMAGPLRLDVTAVMPIPPSWSRAKQGRAVAGTELPTGKPDASNIVKAVEDALNAVAYADDSQLVDLAARKVYGKRPGLYVVVSQFKGGR